MSEKAATYKSLLEYACLAILVLLIALFATRCELNRQPDADSIYQAAYDEGYEAGLTDAGSNAYDNGYHDGYNDGSDCWDCGANLHSSGLCLDCRSGVTECVFCYSPAFDWDTTYGFTVCPKCLGEAWEKTNLEDFLRDFNENR